MQRPSVYDYQNDTPPGSNVYRLRTTLQLSQRALADACHPALDHTTIRRLENNEGFTQDTLERVAAAFSKKFGTRITVPDLFLPADLADWPTLPKEVRERLAESVKDAAAAQRYRVKQN